MKKKVDDDNEDRRTSQKSVMSRISDTLSMRSRTRSSVAPTKDMVGGLSVDSSGPQKARLRVRDWILAVAEFCSAFCWTSYIERAKSEPVLLMRGMTPRQQVNEQLMWTGCAAFGNLLLGHFSDAYAGIYTILMLNVTTQFTLGALFLMSEIINDAANEDEYGLLLAKIYVWSFIPIKSTEFAREVYALQQLAVKDNALVLYFSFVVLLSGSLGYVAFHITSRSGISSQVLNFLVFCANGVVLYFYTYIVTPPKTQSDMTSRCANEVWACIITAIRNRRRFGRTLNKKTWLDYAELRYEKHLIRKAKALIKLFCLILPTAGFLLFTTSDDVIFQEVWKEVGTAASAGFNLELLIAECGWIVIMLLIETIVIPLLSLMGIRFTFLKRFVIGYTALLLSIFYAAIVLAFIQKIHYERNVGMLRVFNARRSAVELQSSHDFANWNITITPDTSVVIRYHVHRPTLIPTHIQFDNETSYTTYLGTAPAIMLGYIIFDPSDIIRIRGVIPLREGPPGNNDPDRARCYVVSFMRDHRKSSITLRYLNWHSHGDIEIQNVIPGEKRVFQVDAGTYSISLAGTSTVIRATMDVGGVYGIFMFADLQDYRLAFDEVITGRKHAPSLTLGITLPFGIAVGVALVALHSFVFCNAPADLVGTSVGFLKFVEQITSWILLIGFFTWHPHLDSPALMIYSFASSAFFFICLVLQLKYRHAYSMEVYALQQLAVKDNALILHFCFIVFFSGALGTTVYYAASDSNISSQLVTFLVFCANGVVLYFYSYILTPPKMQSTWASRNANEVWACIITAIRNRRKFGGSLKKKSWLDYAEVRFEKSLIAKAKSLLKLFSLIIPTAGFLLFSTSELLIFDQFWKQVEPEAYANFSWELVLSESTWLIAMLAMEFIVIPLLRSMGIRLNFLRRFVFGYIALVFSIFYSAILLSSIQKIQYESDIGTIRIFNARKDSVNMHAADKNADWNFTVLPNSAISVKYHIERTTLMRIFVTFNNNSKYTTHMGVRPARMLSYVIVDPSDILRIPEDTPFREGPPGNNDPSLARCYVVSFMRDKRQFSVKFHNWNGHSKDVTILKVVPGERRLFQMEGGDYTISLIGTSTTINANLAVGGVYGIFMFADQHDYRLAYDEVVANRLNKPLLGLGVSIPFGMALSIALVSLHAFVFSNAPAGLLGISVGFLKFMEQITTWVLLIGYRTWHPFLDAPALLIYSFAATAFFFVCLVVLVKYKQAYSM